MSGRLEDRVSIVTGASRGIGKAIASAFVREGATVILASRKQESLDAVAAELGARAVPMACHVGRAEDIDRLADEVSTRYGRIDVLVNNAATNIAQGPCLSFSDAQFDKMVEVNLKSVYRFTQRVAPLMCRRGSGSIVNISSVSGIRPQFESLLYSMTKAALIMMTRSYALELGPSGVRVNAIAPGLIQTQLSEYFWKNPEREEFSIDRQPIRHLGQPEEVAETAVLLASGEGSYITGSVFTVDGGMLLA
ncbi:MAG: SDR family NAD(P)-dependent oxidoreductase [Bryobacteraceae bacterium]